MNKIVAICGPTAVGKQHIRLKSQRNLMARLFRATLCSYINTVDIGSAKPSPDELNQVKHHLIGVVEPSRDV